MDQPISTPAADLSDLSSENTELVRAVLARLDEIEPGLTDKGINYVASGEDREMLESVRRPGAAALLDIFEASPDRAELCALYGRSTLSPEQWFRLGRIWRDADHFAPSKCQLLRRELRMLDERDISEILDFTDSGVRALIFQESAKCGLIEGSSFQNMEFLLWFILWKKTKNTDVIERTFNELLPHANHILSFPGALKYLKANRTKIAKSDWMWVIFARLPQLLDTCPDYLASLRPIIQRRCGHLLGSHGFPGAKNTETFIKRGDVDPKPLADHIIRHSVKAKRSRGDFRKLLSFIPDETIEYAKKIFEKGDTEDSIQAACMLDAARDPRALAILNAQLEKSSDPKLSDALRYIIEHDRSGDPDPAKDHLEAHAKAKQMTPQAPLPGALKQRLIEQIETINSQRAQSHFDLNMIDATQFVDALESLILEKQHFRDLRRIETKEATPLAQTLFAHPDSGYLHLVRLMLLAGDMPCARRDGAYLFGYGVGELTETFAEVTGEFSLTSFLAACLRCGVDRQQLTANMAEFGFVEWLKHVPLADLVSYFSVDPRPLLAACELTPYNLGFEDEDLPAPFLAYQVLGERKQLSPFVESELIRRAMVGTPTRRSCSRHALRNTDNLAEKIGAAFQSKETAHRKTAAQWLGDVGDPRAIAVLEAHMPKERSSLVRAHLLKALGQLGHDLDVYLSPQALLEQANKDLPKKLPAKLAWFPFEILPTLHWKQDKSPVDPQIIKWWLFSAVQLGEVEPSELHALYFEQLSPEGIQDWGHAIFLAWMMRDERFHNDVVKRAKDYDQEVQLMWTIPGVDPAKALEAMRRYQNAKPSPASSSKGLLAWVASCQPPEISEPIDAYVRAYVKEKTAFCKQLLVPLSHIDDMRALSVLSGIADGIRSGSVKRGAMRLIEEVATRKGWTVDELSDRTLSRAGLEANGERILDLGGRTVTVRLGDDFAVQILDEAGKIRKSLPAKRVADDELGYASAKKDFQSTKKAIKTIVKDQSLRLRHNMRAHRTWEIHDWTTYIAGHPVLSKMATQLIWAVQETPEEIRFFRPMSDGTLTDEHDESFDLPKQGKISIAHGCMMSGSQAKAWATHLADYEITPLFPQIADPLIELSPQQLAATKWDGYSKQHTTFYRFRNRVVRNGFVHEEPQDAGGIYGYELELPGTDLVATIGIDDAFIGMDDDTIEVGELSFSQKTENQKLRPLKLEQVPAALVHDCIVILRDIMG